MLMNGTIFTGGTTSTNFPQLYIRPTGTTDPSNFNVNGTLAGLNAPSGFAGAFIEAWAGGGGALFIVANTGSVTSAAGFSGTTSTSSGNASAKLFLTATNCTSAASPAVCGSAASGMVTIAAAASTVTVNESGVTANSDISVTQQISAGAGTRLGVTCNATPVILSISNIVAGVSFQVTSASAAITNPDCLSYLVFN
jgi:hypothetical protein